MRTLTQAEFIEASMDRKLAHIYAVLSQSNQGFSIPLHDNYHVTYNAGGNVKTIVYKLGSVTVKTQTFTYDDETVPTGKITDAVLT